MGRMGAWHAACQVKGMANAREVAKFVVFVKIKISIPYEICTWHHMDKCRIGGTKVQLKLFYIVSNVYELDGYRICGTVSVCVL